MTQEQLLSSLKKDVRSLLISAKQGLTPDQLKRDYINMLGHPMPLRILGFRNVLDMIREMPDVVYVLYLGDGSIVLKAVADDATRGIVELVAKQRSAKKAPAQRGGVGFFSSRYHHHNPMVLPRRGHAPPALPAQLRAQLHQLLSHGAVGLSELETAFARRFGFPLRVNNYGFYSIAEMLAAAADLVAVTQSRMGSQLSLRRAVVSSRIRTGPIKPLFPLKQTFNTVPIVRQMTQTNSVPVERHTTESSAPNPVSSTQNLVVPAPLPEAAVLNSPEGDQGSLPMDYTTPQPEPEPTQDGQLFQKCVIKLEEELRQRILENGQAGTVSPELKAKLRQVVAQNSEGLSVHDLPAEFKRVFGEELPVVQSGFMSTTEMVGALSDTLYLQRMAGNDGNHWVVMDIQNAPGHTTPQQPGTAEPEGPVEGVKALNPSGTGYYFSCGESPWEGEGGETKPNLEEDMELRITTKTFYQMVDMYGSLPVRCRRGAVIPPDAMRGQRLRAPTCRGPRELVAVLVEHVESPSNFYIRFDESQEARALENMMIEMRSCYTCPEVSERYRLPERYVRTGQVCCVAPQGIWFYRVVVHRVLNDTHAEVYYVDFGDLTTVQRSSLNFLKSCYSELPAQAVPSSLAGIKPFGGSWSANAKTSFQKLCCDRTLVAALHGYHADFLQLFLCDTHTEEDVYIHRALQAQGHGLCCAPAVSAALCNQFNPVSLYLGEGVFGEGMEIEDEDPTPEPCHEATTITSQHTTQPLPKSSPCPTHTTPNLVGGNKTNAEEVLPDLPALEFIEVTEVNSTAQGGLNPFAALQSKDPLLLCCSDWDQGWTPNDPAPTPALEVVQSKADLGNHGDTAKVFQPPPPSPSAGELKQPCYVNGGVVSLIPAVPPQPSTLKTLSLHTSGLTQTQSAPYGTSVFPLFGTGDMLHVTSPFALGPAARLATGTGSHLLNWYPHKMA
ncbi:tudor domain-containing protein 5-like [Salvelinus fontinalis]|uniref:tudor domain-containing protein 5-like n=1 Tax=Salvelinus fontinalis TaxID=8038 RepID=UPI0024867DE3|nr:tudor domain-containing protein 5-like [Salvelinus fontinalis]XP_055797047.1 tudor domain-containing protein 5-like [Salvelinus fontinalis]